MLGAGSERRETKEIARSKLVRGEVRVVAGRSSTERFVSARGRVRFDFDFDREERDLRDLPERIERLVCEALFMLVVLVNFGTWPRSAAVWDCESGVGAEDCRT